MSDPRAALTQGRSCGCSLMQARQLAAAEKLLKGKSLFADGGYKKAVQVLKDGALLDPENLELAEWLAAAEQKAGYIEPVRGRAAPGGSASGADPIVS